MIVSVAQLIKENAPEGFLKDLCETIRQAYRDADNDTADHHYPEEAYNLRPFTRRAHVHDALKDLAIRHSLKFTSIQIGKFWYITRIYLGNMILDAAHVTEKLAPVRRSEYRETSAESNQLVFEFMEKNRPLDGNHVYGIVLHGEAAGKPSELAYLDIALPDESLRYVDSLDVLALFRNDEVAPTNKPDTGNGTEDEDLVALLGKDKVRKTDA